MYNTVPISFVLSAIRSHNAKIHMRSFTFAIGFVSMMSICMSEPNAQQKMVAFGISQTSKTELVIVTNAGLHEFM